MTEEEQKARERLDELLARTRKNIAESQALVEQAELRIAETDRYLAEHGLTREQVSNMRFTREQKLAVNEELRRRGLPPLEDDDSAYDFDAAAAEFRDETLLETVASDPGEDALSERRRKFNNFMQAYRI